MSFLNVFLITLCDVLIVGLVIFCVMAGLWILIEFLPDYDEPISTKIMCLILLLIAFCSSLSSVAIICEKTVEQRSLLDLIGFAITFLLELGIIIFAHRHNIAVWCKSKLKRTNKKEVLNENEEFAKKIVRYTSSTKYYR